MFTNFLHLSSRNLSSFQSIVLLSILSVGTSIGFGYSLQVLTDFDRTSSTFNSSITNGIARPQPQDSLLHQTQDGLFRAATLGTPSKTNYCANPTITTSLGKGPAHLAFDKNNSLYISNAGSMLNGNYVGTGLNKVTNGAIINYGDQTFEPNQIAVSNENLLYTSNYSPSSTITKTTSQSSTLFYTYTNSQGIGDIKADQTGNLYVTYLLTDSSQIGIDAFTPEGVRTQLVVSDNRPNNPLQIKLTTNALYYNSRKEGRDVIKAIGLTSQPLGTIATPGDDILSISTSGDVVYVLSKDKVNQYVSKLIVQEPTSEISPISLISTLPITARTVTELAVSPTTGDVYTWDYGSQEIVKISPEGIVTGVTLTSKAAFDIAIDSAGNVFYANYYDGTIRQINCNDALNFSTVTTTTLQDAFLCKEQMSGNPVDCYFNLVGSPSYGYTYTPNSITLTMDPNNSNMSSSICSLYRVDSLACTNIPSNNLRAGIATIKVTGNTTNTSTVTLTKGQVYLGGYFSGWNNVAGTTPSRPEIASFNGKLYIAVRGIDNKIYLRSSNDGKIWTNWSVDPFSYTELPVSMVTVGSKLYQTSVGAGQRIYTRSTTDGIIWSPWSENGGTTKESVALANFNGNLVQAVKGSDGQIYTRQYNTMNTLTSNINAIIPWITDPVGKTDKSVSLATQGNTLYEAVRGQDSSIYVRSTNDGQVWTNWQNSGGQTNYAVSLINVDVDGDGPVTPKLYLSAIGTNGLVYTRFSGNTGWTNWSESTGTTSNPISSIVLNTTLFQARTGLDGGISVRQLN